MSISHIRTFILGISVTLAGLLAIYGAFAFAQTLTKSTPVVASFVAKTAAISTPISFVGEEGHLISTALYVNKIEVDNAVCYYATDQFSPKDLKSLTQIKALGCFDSN